MDIQTDNHDGQRNQGCNHKILLKKRKLSAQAHQGKQNAEQNIRRRLIGQKFSDNPEPEKLR